MFRSIIALFLLIAAPVAHAADSTVSALSAASALTGTELFYCVQSAADRKCTASQLRSFGNPVTDVPTLSGQAYTTVSTDLGKMLAVTAGASTATITLLSAVTAGDGAIQYVYKADSGAGRVVVSDGADQAWLSVQADIVAFRSNGASWAAVGWNIKPIKLVCTSTCTWTKPPLASRVRATLFGVGGAGGSGARRGTGGIRTGGGGGGQGAIVQQDFPASILGSTETVTVPAGPAGGVAISVDTTNGNIGTTGSSTTFGSWLTAVAGLPGTGGAAANATGGGSQLQQSNLGIPVAGGTSASTAGGSVSPVNGPAGAGGGGGAADASNVQRVPVAGGGGSTFAGTTSAAGTAGTAGNAGGNGADITDTDMQLGGGGGGGGFFVAATAGTAGGNGGAPSGGGGGGGASDNGTNSGKGGDGGRGEARILTAF